MIDPRGSYCTPWPVPHDVQTCRWCWEESCTDLAEYIIFPPYDLRVKSATVEEYCRLASIMPDRLFSGHRP